MKTTRATQMTNKMPETTRTKLTRMQQTGCLVNHMSTQSTPAIFSLKTEGIRLAFPTLVLKWRPLTRQCSRPSLASTACRPTTPSRPTKVAFLSTNSLTRTTITAVISICMRAGRTRTQRTILDHEFICPSVCPLTVVNSSK